jgi:ribonuclease Y
MQAGREIMVYVNPKMVDDLEIENVLKEIWKKIEDQLDYPGVIRILGIRETKIIQYLR